MVKWMAEEIPVVRCDHQVASPPTEERTKAVIPLSMKLWTESKRERAGEGGDGISKTPQCFSP